MRAKSIKNNARVNREYTVAELKVLLKNAQEKLSEKEILLKRI